MSHNSKLTTLLNDIREMVDNAKDSSDLISAINLAKNFNGEISYNFNPHYFISLLFVAAGAITLYLDSENYFGVSTSGIWVGAILLGVSFCILLYTFAYQSSISDLNTRIFKMDAMFDNNLIKLEKENPFFNYMYDNFETEFSRGNHSRKFLSGFERKFDPNNLNLFSFKYTNSRTVTSTDAKGNITTRTVYDHYYRYGVVLDFNYAKNIEIKSNGSISYPVDYNSASIDFSKKFKVGANSLLDAAKFLKPTVVLAIEELAKSTGSLNIEIDSNGRICFSCTDSDLVNISKNREHGLHNPEAFAEEIGGFTKFEKLEKIMACFSDLVKYNDNNFK